jgi:hypothetical protein
MAAPRAFRKGEAMAKRTIYRDSGNGRIISEKQAERKNPNTWEKERVNVPPPKRSK